MSKSKTQSREKNSRRQMPLHERSQRPQSFQQLPSRPNTGQQNPGQQGSNPTQGDSNNKPPSPPKDSEKK